MKSTRLFWLGCGFEAGLLGIALALAGLFGEPLASPWAWSTGAVVLGALASAPPFGFLVWSWTTRCPLTADVRRFLEDRLLPALAPLSVWQLAVLSCLAGLGEEALFRGALQSVLSRWVGVPGGIAIASLAFGAAHAVNREYFVLTTLIGIYLGLQFWWTGALAVPVTCHAVYDFVALVYLLRCRRRA